MKTKIKS